MDENTERHLHFTRRFSESESAMTAFAYSLVPNRADADDIIQEALKALWQKFDDYDPEKPFLPWANRFVFRQVQIHRRKSGIRSKYFFSESTFEHLADELPAIQDRNRDVRSALDGCLQKLSPKNRELIEQRYLSSGSMQDYAKETGRSPNSIYKMLQRLRDSLHQCITEHLKKEECPS